MSASERVSRFGEYRGFSEPIYDGWERESLYVEARDGTKLAVDVFRPTRDGEVETQPLPVVWKSKRYLRATVTDGRLDATLLSPDGPADQSLQARQLIAHGYVLATADMRGTGASFGTWTECSDPSSSTDGYDVTEWLAAQPWCDGNIGMFGASYEGRMQLNAASAAPPHLKAIMPEVSPFDWYEVIHDGGIFERRFQWTGDHFRSCDIDTAVAPVDDDPDGSMVAQASKEHEATNDYSATRGELPFRDSANAAGVRQWLERSGEALLPGIVQSGVATYHTSGFYARMGLDQLLWFTNLERSATKGRHKILMGPWPHGGVIFAESEIKGMWATETLRFFDHWLKGVDNGIMDEPPVIYTTQTSTTDREVREWRFAPSWPPPESHPTDFYFGEGTSGTIDSVNDGLLAAGEPRAEEGGDQLTVDYGLASPPRSSGSTSEMTSGRAGMWEGGPAGIDFRDYDRGSLTYTSAPLDAPLEVTGHPIVHLFVSSSAEDGDFFVWLEDVDENGVSTYVTRRCLRASHRKTSESPYYCFDAPWHAHLEEETGPIPAGEVVELGFDLMPNSFVFGAGHRIRVTVSGADADIAMTPELDPPPRITVHRGRAHPSRITLPVVG